MKHTIDHIRAKAPEYGAIPFWSWNDKLEEDTLRAQIRTMKNLHMGGFFMHARGGLETEYLSDEWFRCINICIDEAKKQGMTAWSYDENGWPSGFAGGKLLTDPANYAVCIRMEWLTEFPAENPDTIACYIQKEDSTFALVDAPCGAAKYLRLYKGYDSSYVDTLDGTITDKFIAATHEEYLRRLDAGDVGTVMPGFFTDEPQYYRWDNPYSNILPAEFKKAYGYEIFPLLPAIFFDFEGADKFRYDYYKLLHELFIKNFIKKIYDWCDAHGMQITGHAVEESSLGGQMMCCGGVMPFYEYEHIPGIDYLGRGIADDIAPKQLGSVCAQLGKKKAISEMFGCCGWDVTPVELKRIADVQYANGVNLMCAHLYPYSERGQRKRDYPNHYSEHNPWQPSLASFDTHYNNLGALLSEGEEYAPVLVIQPIHGAYMKYHKNTDSLAEIEGKFFALSRLLGQNQVPYHYGDEWLMRKYARVEGKAIQVGACRYDAVVIPFTYTLDRSTAELIRVFVKNGGKVWLYDKTPACIDGEAADMTWLTSTCTKEDIFALRDAVIESKEGKNVPEIRKMTRVTGEGKLLYLTNIQDIALDAVQVTLDNSYQIAEGGTIAELNLDTWEVTPVRGKRDGDCFTVTLSFEPGESHVLLPATDVPFVNESQNHAGLLPADCPAIPLPEVMALAEKPRNMLTLDTAEVSYNGREYESPLSVMGIKDNLLRMRYDGDVWLRFSYEVTADYLASARELCVVTEPMNITSLAVNGVEVRPIAGKWWFDRHFAVTDALPYTHAGKNTVTIKLHHHQREEVYYVLYGGVSESLRNCLAFDCEVEGIYLTGDFCVSCKGKFTPGERRSVLFDGTFALDRQRDVCRIANIVTDGYPFYAGHFKVHFPYEYHAGGAAMLHLPGRWAVCAVSVNGTPVGEMMFSQYLDLSPYLTEGENDIALDLCNSNRNLMGPHHRHDPEPYAVGPGTFSFEKEWNGRSCPAYTPRYAFVRFGIGE